MAIIQSCKEALQAILSLVDYTENNCSLDDTVGSVLPRKVIRAAKDAIVVEEESEYHRKQRGDVEQAGKSVFDNDFSDDYINFMLKEAFRFAVQAKSAQQVMELVQLVTELRRHGVRKL